MKKTSVRNFKRLFMSFPIILFIACSLLPNAEEIDNKIFNMGENNIIDTSRFFVTKNQSLEDNHLYPKGFIPKWVKDSLPRKEYELVFELSKKYKMSYYLLKDIPKQDKIISEHKNKETINYLLHIDSNAIINHLDNTNLTNNSINQIETLSLGEGGNFESRSQTNQFYQKFLGTTQLYATVSTGYMYDPIQKIASEIKACVVNVNSYGVSIEIYWQDQGSFAVIIDNGKKLSVHIAGRIMSKVGIGGIGSDVEMQKFTQTFQFDVNPA